MFLAGLWSARWPITVAMLLGSFVLPGHADRSAPTMAEAARHLIDALSPALRERAVLPLDGDERTNWHYVPRARRGVSLKEMDLAARRAAHALVRTALSTRGYLKVTAIMVLEAVLREMESRPERPAVHRDPELYYFTVFGQPSDDDAAWGWRVEGHHVSLNFSSVTGVLVGHTPAFLGANPSDVPTGPQAGLRVLAAEAELAFELLESLDETQRGQAMIATAAPADVVCGPGRSALLEDPLGLTAAAMTEPQRALLWRLVEEYARNLRRDLADRELARIRAAGFEAVRFAWAGAVRRGKRHYYRIDGPTFVIEYDCTTADPEHVHSLWRDPSRDFGGDLLERHRREDH